jgi:von Willebrand factor type A domain
MDDRPGFTLAVSQNKYLSTDDNEMHAILTVTAHDIAGTPHEAPEAAEVIAIDCSGSMSNPPTKIAAARHATAAAIDALRDGVFFAVVEGTHTARTVYPTEQRLIAATPETKTAAKKAVRHLIANGATAMGAWLRLADQLLDAHPAAVRHVMLLTDGRNLPEYKQDLDEALVACEGKFVCDGRGIGDDYAPEELQRIVSTLRGSADAILDDSDLVSEFTAMMWTAMSKVVPDVRLQIRTMPFTRLRFVKQEFPTETDLTELGMPINARTTGFSTGSWSEGEDREFHVCLEVDRAELAMYEDIQAARVDLAIVYAGSTEAHTCGKPEAIRVHWTDDIKLSSVLDLKMAHYAGHTELGNAVKAGRDALDADDVDRAAREWGRAVALAAKLGHDKMLTRLGRLVDIVGDPAAGVVRVKQNLQPREIASAMLGSYTSTHSPDSTVLQSIPQQPAGPDRACPNCGYVSPSTAAICEPCGYSLGETA